MKSLAQSYGDIPVPIAEIEHHLRKSFVADGTCPAWVLRYKHTDSVPFHDHAFHELALVEDGSSLHRTPHRTHEIQSGDALLVQPGVWHRYETGSDGMRLANCLIDSGLFGSELAWLHDEPFLGAFLWSDPRQAETAGFLHVSLDPEEAVALRTAFAAIERVQAQEGVALRRTYVIAQLLLCFFTLASALARQGRPVPAPAPLHGAVRAALRCMSTRLAESWTVEALARQSMNISPSYLLELFRSQLGQSPMAMLNRFRLERTAGLLVGTQMGIAEIAALVGIDDPNYLTRRFRLQFGMTPTEFRHRKQGKTSH